MSTEPHTAATARPALIPPEAEQSYKELEAKVRAARPGEDTAQLRAAFEFAAAAHAGQFRRSGEPFIFHPLAVAHILADRRMDLVSLQAALLHDVVEDCGVDIKTLEERFGKAVAQCVDGVTKLSKLTFESYEKREAESMRKMLLAMVSDIRVVLVKLADRLHNMRTLDALGPEARERFARTTLHIYAPIANRLGMGKIRAELEDLAFRYLEPEAYEQLATKLAAKQAEHERFLEEASQRLKARLEREGIPGRIEYRVKRIYSIYQKLRRQRITLDQVFDLLALRVITDTVSNCYVILGVVHNEWPAVPGRVKDFISLPRPNQYQSLHTTVIGPGGVPFEVQIRTEEMHRVAEEGIAAHWKYKEGVVGTLPDEHQIAWLRGLLEWQQEMRDPGDFFSTLRLDLYPEEVYTFTPKGKVIVLPRGATPIDFAYAIHSEVGHTCVGAKVNGRIVSLRYQLRNGDVVEILTQAGATPSRDWLSLVKTSRARNKIRQFIRAQERARAIELGQKLLEREARRYRVALGRVSREALEKIAGEYGCGRVEDLYAALGYGRYSARQVLVKAVPELAQEETAAEQQKPAPTRPSGETGATLRVRDIDGVLIYRAKCCNPIPGEPIVGYVTRGKGVAVHRLECKNVQNLLYEPERKIEVEWAESPAGTFPVKLLVYADDRPGMLASVTNILSAENSNIQQLEAHSQTRRGDNQAVIEMTVEVRDMAQYRRIVTAMERLAGVHAVERVQ